MLNSEGKKVKGFKFNKSTSEIIFPPQHFRIAGKDYITIAEKNGQVDALKVIVPASMTLSELEIATAEKIASKCISNSYVSCPS